MRQRNPNAFSFLFSKSIALWALGYFGLGLIVSFQLPNHWSITLPITVSLGWSCALFCVVAEAKTLIDNKVAILFGAEVRAKERSWFSRFTRDGIEVQTLTRAKKRAEVELELLTIACFVSLILLIGSLLSFFFIMVDSTDSRLFMAATTWIGTSIYWLPATPYSLRKRHSAFYAKFCQIGLSATLGLLLGGNLGLLIRTSQWL